MCSSLWYASFFILYNFYTFSLSVPTLSQFLAIPTYSKLIGNIFCWFEYFIDLGNFTEPVNGEKLDEFFLFNVRHLVFELPLWEFTIPFHSYRWWNFYAVSYSSSWIISAEYRVDRWTTKSERVHGCWMWRIIYERARLDCPKQNKIFIVRAVGTILFCSFSFIN